MASMMKMMQSMGGAGGGAPGGGGMPGESFVSNFLRSRKERAKKNGES